MMRIWKRRLIVTDLRVNFIYRSLVGLSQIHDANGSPLSQAVQGLLSSLHCSDLSAIIDHLANVLNSSTKEHSAVSEPVDTDGA